MKSRWSLGVIWYGPRSHCASNREQLAFFDRALTSFRVRSYDLTKGDQAHLLKDFSAKRLDIIVKNSYSRVHEADIETWLTLNNVPYLGSESEATFLATSKNLSKQILKLHGVPTLPHIFITPLRWQLDRVGVLHEIRNKTRNPVIIKDDIGTDSRGISIATSASMTMAQMKRAVAGGSSVVVESYLQNAYEVTCLVAGRHKPQAHEPVGVAGRGMFSVQQKDHLAYQPELPAKLSSALRHRIKELSLTAHQALGCRDFSRADFLIFKSKPYMLEVDVHPGFREQSATTLSLAYEGVGLDAFFVRLAREALQG